MYLLSCVIATCVILGSVATRSYLFSRDSVSPFQDAVVSWHMNGLNSSEGDESQLTGQGNVKLGVDLLDTERSDSMQRPGDGQVAVFDGGYLLAGEEAEKALDLRSDMIELGMKMSWSSAGGPEALSGRSEPEPADVVDLFLAAPESEQDVAVGQPVQIRVPELEAAERCGCRRFTEHP